ncbi:UNVERIFIED_CONTAM: hypothetical protein GTU68_021053, partial [Idotea baltica]|nr:hypothetical protein [Idotea baltica]
HLYKATPRDLIALKRAELVFYVGLHLEGRLADTFSKMKERGERVYAVSDQVPDDKLLQPEEFEGAHDPHIWFDPSLWSATVQVVVDALSVYDSEHADFYAANGDAYQNKIKALVAWTSARIDEVPQEHRYLVTSHDAYNYFGQAFGIQVVGVQGISTAVEAGLADVSKTVDFIRRKGIPAIFVESSVSPATIDRISKDSGAVVGGELFSDALGELGDIHKGHDVGTYIGMFKYNVDTIVDALK